MAKTIHSPKHIKLRTMLRAERKKRKLTQHQVAAKADFYKSIVTKYETGERRLDLVEFLTVAKAIGFDPHAFIDDLELE